MDTILHGRKMETEKVKLSEINTLIEYQGDFYTPEELAKRLGVSMDHELTRPK